MKELEVSYEFFKLEDGNALSLESRIKETAILFEKSVYVVFEDGQKCFNEEELRAILKEKGIL